MSETQLQERVCELLELHGWLPLESDKAKLGKRGKKKGAFVVGFPDVLALKGGSFLLLELKVPKGKVRPEQAELHARFAALGIEVAVCRDEADVLALLRGRTRRLAGLYGSESKETK